MGNTLLCSPRLRTLCSSSPHSTAAHSLLCLMRNFAQQSQLITFLTLVVTQFSLLLPQSIPLDTNHGCANSNSLHKLLPHHVHLKPSGYQGYLCAFARSPSLLPQNPSRSLDSSGQNFSPKNSITEFVGASIHFLSE